MQPMIDENKLDVYFTEAYGKLYEKHENCECRRFVHQCIYGTIISQFLFREVPYKIEGLTYYDIITPYGYGGPLIYECESGKEDELMQDFIQAFAAYCEKERIVSEFIRFHPLIKNHQYFLRDYCVQFSRQVVSIALQTEETEPWKVRFSHTKRTKVRSGIREEVVVKFDWTGESIDTFIQLYQETMNRKSAQDYYYFNREYFEMMIETMPDKICFANAIVEGEIVCSELRMIGNDYIHAHLQGRDARFNHLATSELCLAVMSTWGWKNGKKELLLGGGLSGAPDDSLFMYKKSFDPTGLHDFYIASKIWNQEIYDALEKRYLQDNVLEEGFFPSYRGKRGG